MRTFVDWFPIASAAAAAPARAMDWEAARELPIPLVRVAPPGPTLAALTCACMASFSSSSCSEGRREGGGAG